MDLINKILDSEVIIDNSLPIIYQSSEILYDSLKTNTLDFPIDFVTKFIEVGYNINCVNNEGKTYLDILGEFSIFFESPVENLYILDKCSICFDKTDKLCYSDMCGHAVLCVSCYAKTDKTKCVMCKQDFGNLKFINLLY
jgi:hypothetical protein